ncbi:MAG TPA: hypothetical protein VNS79_12290 [Sphingobium sp.]|nr:hypothetical protein [Sphingobium sp.]
MANLGDIADGGCATPGFSGRLAWPKANLRGDDFLSVRLITLLISLPQALIGRLVPLAGARTLLWEPNNMKKFAVASAAVVLMSLAACGEKPAAESNDAVNEVVVDELDNAADAVDNAADAVANAADELNATNENAAPAAE